MSNNSVTFGNPENFMYQISEILVGIGAVIGNALVILVFYRESKIRTPSNFQIISLAVADFFMGLFGVPIAILVSNLLFESR